MSLTPATVAVQDIGQVRVLRLSNPPVNAMSHSLRVALLEALRAAAQAPGIGAVVMAAEGKNFVGGADIREFGQPRQAPFLRDITQAIAQHPLPIAVAMQGPAIGGGLEIALAARHRVAGPQAVFALPESQLGLLPGAGGTQRITRLLGAQRALELMLSGRRLNAADALSAKLVHQLADDPLGEALHWARQAAEQPHGAPMADAEAPGLDDEAANRSALAATRSQWERTPHVQPSHRHILEAVEAALNLPLEQGLALEAQAFEACLNSPERQGLIHAFFAERRAQSPHPASSPGVPPTEPLPLRQVGVIGGGTMGSGIAIALLEAGLPVTLIERYEEAAQQAHQRIAAHFEGQQGRGRISPAQAAQRMSLLECHHAYTALGSCDLVIEAVFEDTAVKAEVLAAAHTHCPPGAVLATNTSYLDLCAMASLTPRGRHTLGLHFFSPAPVMKLLEVVSHPDTAPEVLATGLALARQLRKVAVPVAVRPGVAEGFIGNRLLHTWRRAMEYLLEDGASPYAIDAALRRIGLPMGPFQMMDLAGGDIAWANRRRRAATRPPHERYVRIADALCERGWLGQKTGRGWYRYDTTAGTGKASFKGQPCDEVLDLVEAERRAAGVSPRLVNESEIIERYQAALVLEAARVLQDGVAQRGSDIDLVLIHGYGFPRWRGGPLNWAEQQGLGEVLQRLDAYAEEDPDFWACPALLRERVAQGLGLSDWSRLVGTEGGHA
jgi:3-hydroxyacyl-CoA dehydrogenase